MVGGLAIAVLAPLAPLLGHGFHVIGLALAAPVAIWALLRGWRAHGRVEALALGGAGLGLMTLGLSLGHGDGREFALTALGAALLAAAHLFNMRMAPTPRG